VRTKSNSGHQTSYILYGVPDYLGTLLFAFFIVHVRFKFVILS